MGGRYAPYLKSLRSLFRLVSTLPNSLPIRSFYTLFAPYSPFSSLPFLTCLLFLTLLLFPSSIFLPLLPFIVKTVFFPYLFCLHYIPSTTLLISCLSFQQLSCFSLPFDHFLVIFPSLSCFLVGFWSWLFHGMVCWIFREEFVFGFGCFLRLNEDKCRCL